MMDNKKSIKGVAIFDLDGTLQKTLPSITIASNLTLAHFDLPGVTEELVESFIGKGARVLVERLMRHAGVESPDCHEEAYQLYLKLFNEHCTDGVEPFEGVPQMLDDLQSMGLELAVVTNKNDKMTPLVLGKSFSLDTFSEIRGDNTQFPLKPNAAQTLEVLNLLGASLDYSFFIGDSDIDVLTGKNAKIRTIAVTWGYQPIERLIAVDPDYMADTPGEVVAYIQSVLDS